MPENHWQDRQMTPATENVPYFATSASGCK